jgi:1-acyl-sn-glycerol-3-phosphate acyltransferase
MADEQQGVDPLDPGAAKALASVQRAVVSYLRRYHRHEITGQLDELDEQVLFVGNHGFGGLFDLNVLALMAAAHRLRVDRPVTILNHQIAWSMGLGPLIEPMGARPASREAAQEGFARGHHVLVLPGGDLDAFKSHKDRDQIMFGGRSGFARLAMEAGVPIVPIVTAGAGNSLLVLSDGQKLAKGLRLDRLLRLKALPISVSIPWGLNIGLVGLLPYIPLPTKLRTQVLPRMRQEADETPAAFAHRVEQAMQTALTELAQEKP